MLPFYRICRLRSAFSSPFNYFARTSSLPLIINFSSSATTDPSISHSIESHGLESLSHVLYSSSLSIDALKSAAITLCQDIRGVTPTPQLLEDITQAIQIFSLNGIYTNNLFDFVDQNIQMATPTTIAAFVQQCGIHGLRCKHYVDHVIARVPRLHEFPVPLLLQMAQGMVRFSKDWSRFFDAVSPIILSHSSSLMIEDLLTLLRVYRDLGQAQKYKEYFLTCCGLLEKKELLIQQSMVALRLLSRPRSLLLSPVMHTPLGNNNNSASRKLLLHCMAVVKNGTVDDLDGFDAESIVYALESITSWLPETRSNECVRKLIESLEKRPQEIRHAPNLSLWLTFFESISRGPAPKSEILLTTMFQYCQDSFMLDRLTFIQQARLIFSLNKLTKKQSEIYFFLTSRLILEAKSQIRSFGEIAAIASSPANAIASEFNRSKKGDIDKIIASYTPRGYFDELIEVCVDLAGKCNGKTKASKKITQREIALLLWSALVGKAEKKQVYQLLEFIDAKEVGQPDLLSKIACGFRDIYSTVPDNFLPFLRANSSLFESSKKSL